MKDGLKRTGTHCAISEEPRRTLRRTGTDLPAISGKAGKSSLKKTGESTAVPDIESLLKGKTILTVDDEDYILTIYQRIFRQMAPGSKVLTAKSVKEAQASITRSRPDIVISDIMMPEQTGDELFDWIKANRPELLERLLFVSGGAGSETTKAGRFYKSMESDGRLLEKPFNIDQVRNKICAILSQAAPLSRTSRVDAMQKTQRNENIGKIRHDANGMLAVLQMSADVLFTAANLTALKNNLIQGILTAAKSIKRLISECIDSESIPESASDKERETIASDMWQSFSKPLGTVMLNAEALKFQGLSEEDEEMVDGILTGATRLRDLILGVGNKIRQGKDIISDIKE